MSYRAIKLSEISPPNQQGKSLDPSRNHQNGNTEAPTSSVSKRYSETFQNFRKYPEIFNDFLVLYDVFWPEGVMFKSLKDIMNSQTFQRFRCFNAFVFFSLDEILGKKTRRINCEGRCVISVKIYNLKAFSITIVDPHNLDGGTG